MWASSSYRVDSKHCSFSQGSTIVFWPCRFNEQRNAKYAVQTRPPGFVALYLAEVRIIEHLLVPGAMHLFPVRSLASTCGSCFMSMLHSPCFQNDLVVHRDSYKSTRLQRRVLVHSEPLFKKQNNVTAVFSASADPRSSLSPHAYVVMGMIRTNVPVRLLRLDSRSHAPSHWAVVYGRQRAQLDSLRGTRPAGDEATDAHGPSRDFEELREPAQPSPHQGF